MRSPKQKLNSIDNPCFGFYMSRPLIVDLFADPISKRSPMLVAIVSIC